MDRILTSAALARAGETVRLAGWIHNIRDLGDVKFLILRDRAGLIQTVLGPETYAALEGAGKESVVEIDGQVAAEERAPGGAEVRIVSIRVIARAEEPPLE